MPAQPAAPMVSRKPSMLNMSFFEELGQMTERSDDDTRKLLGKFAAEPEGSLPAMPPALKRLVSGEASGPPKMTRSNSAYLREMAQAQAQAQAQASSSSSYQPLPPGAMDAPPAMAPPMVSGPPMVSKRKSSELLEEGLNLFTGGHLPNFSFSGVRARALLRPRPAAPAPCACVLHPRPAPAPCARALHPRPAPAPCARVLLRPRPAALAPCARALRPRPAPHPARTPRLPSQISFGDGPGGPSRTPPIVLPTNLGQDFTGGAVAGHKRPADIVLDATPGSRRRSGRSPTPRDSQRP